MRKIGTCVGLSSDSWHVINWFFLNWWTNHVKVHVLDFDVYGYIINNFDLFLFSFWCLLLFTFNRANFELSEIIFGQDDAWQLEIQLSLSFRTELDITLVDPEKKQENDSSNPGQPNGGWPLILQCKCGRARMFRKLNQSSRECLSILLITSLMFISLLFIVFLFSLPSNIFRYF